MLLACRCDSEVRLQLRDCVFWLICFVVYYTDEAESMIVIEKDGTDIDHVLILEEGCESFPDQGLGPDLLHAIGEGMQPFLVSIVFTHSKFLHV